MQNKLFQRIIGKTIPFTLLCLLHLAGMSAFISADAHAKSASEVFDIASKSTVVILGYVGKGKASYLGSGVVIPGGSVATNCHVIEKATRLAVRYQRQEYLASRQYTDHDRDTCSLTVQGLNAPAVTLGTTRGLKVGAQVYAIGAPQGLELTLSEGIVSSLREIMGGKYIQTTAPISPGSSGGGLFDKEGRLLGLTTFYLAKGQNLNFALPVEWIGELSKRHAKVSKPATSAVVWINKAIELEKRKDLPGMIAHCRRWTSAEPKNAFSWFFLGFAYGESGQTSRAIECFQKALSIDPEKTSAWYNLGLAYEESGQTSRAIECYQKALSIDPEYTSAWRNLGLCYRMAGQHQRVMEVYRKLKKLDPNLAEEFFKIVVLP